MAQLLNFTNFTYNPIQADQSLTFAKARELCYSAHAQLIINDIFLIVAFAIIFRALVIFLSPRIPDEKTRWWVTMICQYLEIACYITLVVRFFVSS